jgi:hypothetical protein
MITSSPHRSRLPVRRSRVTYVRPRPGRPVQSETVAGRSRADARELVLYGVLAVLAVLGLMSPGQFNLVPAESVLEVVFLVLAGLSARSVAEGGRAMLVLGGGYVLVKALLLVFFSSASITDFMQAYKSFYYLALLGFFVGKRVFDGRRLASFTTFLIAAFLLKYGYSVVLGLDDRPGIFMENNFELIMLLGLFQLAWPYLGRRRDLLFGAVAVIVLLSGSRSAALGLLVIYVFLYLKKSNRTWPLHVAGVVVVGYVVLSVFTSRAAVDGAARLDRLNFLDIFLYEVREWPIWEFVTGSFPLTPLSPGSCGSLSFYSVLFSKTDPGTCYSVILHSFFLRAVFDHGLLGVGILMALVWLGLRRSGRSIRDTVGLLVLVSVSGLSVSAFNNVFVAIVLAVAMGLSDPVPEAVSAGPETRNASPSWRPAGMRRDRRLRGARTVASRRRRAAPGMLVCAAAGAGSAC